MTISSSASFQTRLGINHGYCFDGDFVNLNAEVSFSDDDLASGLPCALQLWSSDQGFAGGLNGVKVAELAIEPMAGGILVDSLCSAMPPAGTGDRVLALALIAFAADGEPQLRDLAIYPAVAAFIQPRLEGNVTCALADGMATLAVDAIENPRSEDNLSGTLALEVWALAAPYAGGAWQGVPVASVILGVLAGGNQLSDCNFVVPAAVPEGPGVLTVMLREWGPAGYVTRDFCNLELDAPVKVGAKAAAKASKAKSKATAKPAAKADAKPAKEKAPTAEPVKKPAKKDATAKAAVKAVSVNKASEAELLAVKGLPPSVARAIIAARPFATLDDVRKAKGMGPKMLDKLRDLLAL